ncbi:hypothetical protein E2320_012100, partial [Naja naja]
MIFFPRLGKTAVNWPRGTSCGGCQGNQRTRSGPVVCRLASFGVRVGSMAAGLLGDLGSERRLARSVAHRLIW